MVQSGEPPNPRKKKPLTEIEMALKREETARKRRNLSEKKLEDEKVQIVLYICMLCGNLTCRRLLQAETINRLLKKQSRTKGKRNALSTAEDRPTPVRSNSAVGGDVDMEEGEEVVPAPVVPTMYRWISTTKAPAPGDAVQEAKLMLSFSVPLTALPQSEKHLATAAPIPAPTPVCDVDGCDALRKYKLVKDSQKGACGMPHLKQLEAQLFTASA